MRGVGTILSNRSRNVNTQKYVLSSLFFAHDIEDMALVKKGAIKATFDKPFLYNIPTQTSLFAKNLSNNSFFVPNTRIVIL